MLDDPAFLRVLYSSAFHPCVVQTWDEDGKGSRPGPPWWLGSGSSRVVANLAGTRLVGVRVDAGAVVRVSGRSGTEWWAVIARGKTAKTAEWAVALLGEGDREPWSR